jgi:hypothetical protein
MLVRALRDDRYVVETEHGTYVVDLDGRNCTCPDHAIRGSRCKHLRRVAIEVTEGRVPPPGKRTAVCAVCGTNVFVPVGPRGPTLCETHLLRPGDLVRDKETKQLLVVTEVTDERADEYLTEERTAIAEYRSNAEYGDHEPVVEAVYLDALETTDGRLSREGAKRYGFPASRLRRLAGDEVRLDLDGGVAAGKDAPPRPRTKQATLPN